MTTDITIGVLALQGAIDEHIKLLRQASTQFSQDLTIKWVFTKVRTPEQLDKCDALIIPGGESTTVSLVAARSNLLEPLRDFVKVHRKPTWGTCAGLILLAESANRTKKGGQDLIGGLDVRVNRNHFGRQTESFETALELPFLTEVNETTELRKFRGVFIRAPIVEKLLPSIQGEQVEEGARDETVIAPSRDRAIGKRTLKPVEILARLPDQSVTPNKECTTVKLDRDAGDIIAVVQENVFGTSFHPELTQDARIHVWWLGQIQKAILSK